MNKPIKSLLVAAALTLPILAATTATAGPDCDNLPPDHPQCSTTPTVPIPDHPDGLTCADEVYGGYDEPLTLTDGTVYGIPLEVGSDRLCIDWTTTQASEWIVTVTDPGAAKSVFVSLRDSHPGDFCWQGVIDVKRGDTDVTMAHTMGPNATGGLIPTSVIDACGDEYTDSAAPYVMIIELGGKPTTASVTIEPADPEVP